MMPRNLSPNSVPFPGSDRTVTYLKGIRFPVKKDKLIEHAQTQGADADAITLLQHLPADQEFKGPFCLSKALGQIGREEPALAVPHAAMGKWEQYSYESEAGSRAYYVYTPANYQIGSPVPLMLMLHGCTEDPEVFATVTRMNQLADQKQFIVVYPQQGCFDNPEECWDWLDASQQSRGSGEPAILAGITQQVQQITSQWTIDASRVYVAGLSAGAAMTVILGATYPDLFTAIGVHSGLEYAAATNGADALLAMTSGGPNPMTQGQLAYQAMGLYARVVPTVVFHGTYDYIVNPVNGDEVIRQWMETDYLASGKRYNASFHLPTSQQFKSVPGGYSYSVWTWSDSNGNAIQEYWSVYGMGHAWSGGSPNEMFSDPLGPDASLAMYTFFMKHQIPTTVIPTVVPTVVMSQS
jgi:poly(hydroxyalkanoate) depolymerase family esterase